ncbi:synaptotagmin-15 [Gadus chalcogrammus]|uniref:synaptotagmin-15 n=1 Tax=Gadus chalcogrammus TaxID=1042646 RepID=UPI0024C4B841|nr:synaptotagmin-15 [Gadus chalcogrammus]
MENQVVILAVGLLMGLLIILCVCILGYCLWRRKGQSQYQEFISTLPLFPECTAPVLQVSQGSRPRCDEIPFTVPPRFEPRSPSALAGQGQVRSDGVEADGQRDILAHRGSLCVRSWYPMGTLLEGLYRGPALDQVAPPPGPAPRLCFAVEYRRCSEQLTVSLLRLGNLPPCFHGNVTLVELQLLPDDRRPRQARARGPGPDPELAECFVFQVSAVCVSESTLSVCVLSVAPQRKRRVVGRVLYPLEGQLGASGRVLWRDLETDTYTQCSELGDVQVSMNYSPSLRRLTLGVVRARGLQLLSDTGVFSQVSLQRHTQVVKTKRSSVVSCGGADPHLDHRMTFKLPPQHLDEACVRLELKQPHPMSPECAAVLGVVVLGPFMYARGPQLQHWLDMVNPTQEPVKQWHGLGRCL